MGRSDVVLPFRFSRLGSVASPRGEVMLCIFDHRESWDTTCSYWVSVHWVKWVACVFSRFLGALGHGHWRLEGCSWCVEEFVGDIHYFIVQLKWAHHTDEIIKQFGDKYCMLYCCNRFVSSPTPASPAWEGPGRAPRRHPLGVALQVRNIWLAPCSSA